MSVARFFPFASRYVTMTACPDWRALVSLIPEAPAACAARVWRPAPGASTAVLLSPSNVRSLSPTLTVSDASVTFVAVPRAVFDWASAGRHTANPTNTRTGTRSFVKRSLGRIPPPPTGRPPVALWCNNAQDNGKAHHG